MKITIDRKNGILEAPIDWKLMEIARELPSKKRWDNSTRPPRLLFEPSPANIEFLRGQFPGAEWLDQTNVTATMDALVALSSVSSAPIERPTDYRFKTEPFEHQLKCFMVSRDRSDYALFLEAGTGKSKIIIDTAAWLWAQGRIDGAFVVAPNGVHRQWLEEQFPAHCPDFVEREAHSWKVGNVPEELFQRKPQLRLFSMNLEALTTENGLQTARRFMKSGRILMVVDESHKIKNPSAKVTKACITLGRDASHRRICTGTPVAKGLEDKFTQMFFLNPFILGFNSFYSFRNNYCVMGGFNNRAVIGYRNVEQFQAKIRPHSARVLKRDCLDLPPKIGGIDSPDGVLKRYVELTPEQRRHYDALKNQFLTELSDGSVVETPLAIQRLVRLQQVLCGHLPREDGTIEIIPSNRVAVCRDLVEEASGKVVIWTRFRHDVAVLEAAFGDRCVTFQEQDAREEAKRLFRDPDSGKDVFISNQAAGGTGVDGLQDVTTNVIYYANSFNSVDRWQSEDRTYRIGTKWPVTYHDLVARGTIDTAIISNLRRKKNIANLTLGELEAMLA